MKIIFFLFFSCILTFSLIAQEEEYKEYDLGRKGNSKKGDSYLFKGLVIDEGSKEPILGANIRMVDDLSIGTSSNQNGEFSFLLERGTYEFKIEYLGYVPKRIKLNIYRNGSITFSMKTAQVALDEVTIKDVSERDNIDQVITGLEQMTIKELERTGKLMGELDVIRSIQSLSGVTSVGDGASGFNVRGGNADENLIIQDNALILNPSHALGFYSLFHPDLVNKVNLYKGDQPADYGGRLSSVLEVSLKEGDTERFKVKGGVGLAASRLTLEGPIINKNTSFIVGGRFSYLNWILNQVRNINVKRSSAFFYDLTAKVDSRLTDKTKIGITAFQSSDDFRFADEVNFAYATRTYSGYINQIITDKININLKANIGNYESSLFDIQGNDVSKFTNRVQYFRPSIKLLYVMEEGKKLTIGSELNSFQVDPGDILPESETSTVSPQSLARETAFAISPFMQIDYDLSDRFAFSAGIRYNYYNRYGNAQLSIYENGQPRRENTIIDILQFNEGESIASYTAFEPRLSLRYKINEESSIKSSFNRSFQYLNQISNTSSATPIDIWQLSDFYIQPQRANNYSIGYFQNIPEKSIQSSIQIFYRDQPNIIEYKDFATLLLNENLEREIVNGEGKAYGVELNIEKNSEILDFQINYTFSRSLRRVIETPIQKAINRGEWYPSNFDKPHALNMRVSKKFSDISELSVNFTYSTGRPLTVPISNFSVNNIRTIPIYSDRNAFRIPDYHRLDVSYTIGPFGNDDWKSTLVFSVFNLYGRDNAYSVFFKQQPFSSVQAFRIATLGSVFPSITYNFEF